LAAFLCIVVNAGAWRYNTRVTTAVLTLVLCAGAVCCGCAGDRSGSNLATVSGELQARGGSPLSTNRNGGTQFSLPPQVTVDDGISESEAVALALWNNAAFNETLAELGFSRADLVQAGLLTNPNFSVLFPLGPKQLEFTATFPLEALWLRPKRVAVAKLQAERVAQTLVQNGLNLIRDVRVAYTDVWLAKERVRLSEAALEVRSRIGTLAEARLRAGDISELEAATARIDALRARDDATRAAREGEIAEDKLRGLLGLGAEKRWNFAFESTQMGRLTNSDELERQALAARPDLRAAELSIEAAGKRVGLAKAEIFALSGILDANGKDSGGLDMGPGASLPIPIFNRNQGGIARARAELERAAWNYQSVKQRIHVEVQEAHDRFALAQATLEQWEQTIMPPLEATTKQSQRAFELGNVSFLLVQENARELINARARQAEIKAEGRRARAELERSVGHRLDTGL
jgi:outer membrane protein, heavy metal efflux system